MFDFDDVPEDMGGPSEQVQAALDAALKERPRPERWKLHKEMMADPAALPRTLGAEVEAEVEELWKLDGQAAWEASYWESESQAPLELPALGVGIAAPRPVPESGKARFCVVFLCGMPQEPFGSARSTDPLPTRILERCWEIGLPTVRFDYPGCGRSKGTMPPTQDMRVLEIACCRMIHKVAADIAEKLVIIGFSAGNVSCVEELARLSREDRLAAYVCVSFGTRANALADPDPKASLRVLKDEMPRLPPASVMAAYERMTAPSLFIVGDQDIVTREEDMQAVLERMSRRCGSCHMGELQVLRGKHGFENGDDAAGPAVAIKEFLLKALTLEE